MIRRNVLKYGKCSQVKNQWNENAGDALAQMVASIPSCSNAMSFVPKPSGSRPGYGWIVTYVYNVFKQRFGMNKGLIFQACVDFRLYQWKRVIMIKHGNGHIPQ